MSSSQSVRSESEMVPELRAVMSDDLFKAAIEGDRDELIRRLRLEPQEQPENQSNQVTIRIEDQREDQTVQSELQSATHFGDTVLHLLVTNRHNKLALNVFQRDMSLLKAQNRMLETPLHCAAKVGNNEIIESLIENRCSIVKDALKKTNNNGDTVLHVLVTKGHKDLALKVFQSDKCLLEAQNGMLETPLHCAAKVGNNEIIDSLIENRCSIVKDALKKTNNNGDTVLHVLVTKGHKDLALKVFQSDKCLLEAQNGMLETPLHCAAKVGNNEIIDSLIENHCSIVEDALKKTNNNGDTVLHLLVTKGHNKHALKVFQSDKCLLEAQNGMFETPLHCAAKVGNNEIIDSLIESCFFIVKDALKKTNNNGDTALHVAAKHGHKDVGCKLMKLDREVAYKVNNEMLSPLKIAIVKENIEMVKKMLEVVPALACTPFSDGMFPIHVAARMDKKEMVMHFIETYPDGAKLLDPRGRNLLHIVAEEDRKDFFRDLFKSPSSGEEMLTTMNNAMDYEGNSLLHIAAMKGHTSMMQAIWQKTTSQGEEENTRQGEEENTGQGEKTNNQGLTPLDLFMRQLKATTEVDYRRVNDYLKTVGHNRLTHEWFDYVLKLSIPNKWDKTQVIGLGSVLITTVAFAAVFTIPGGYKQDNGTPVLVRRYMFRAFIVANTLAFILAFSCLFKLFKKAMEDQPGQALDFAIDTFMLAASSMVVAFGLGLYLTLAPDCLPIAIIVLVSTLLVSIVNMSVRSNNWSIGLPSYAVTYLLIFGLAFLS